MREFLIKYKSAIYSGVLLVSLMAVYYYRKNNAEEAPVSVVLISGYTMGTNYQLKFLGDTSRVKKIRIDSLLEDLNGSVSTYVPTSEISEFNRMGMLKFRSSYFKEVLYKAKEIFDATGGHFDPTVMPLVNAYGFGYEEKNIPDSNRVDSLLGLVGMDKIRFDQDSVWSDSRKVQLDFSAIAKGYGSDVVARFLESNGVENYMVEIGGEVCAKGRNEKGSFWNIGIVDPGELKNTKKVIPLQDLSMATSGNYLNFHETDGVLYSHTINPRTGYPERNNMLSVTVIAKDCMTADAMATGFMVMGPEKGIPLATASELYQVFFIYSEGEEVKTFSTVK